MTALELLNYLTDHKAIIRLNGDGLKIIDPELAITPEILSDLRLHKPAIVGLLDANEPARRYAYHYRFKDGKGSGTWLCDIPPDIAQLELSQRFPGYELEAFALLN